MTAEPRASVPKLVRDAQRLMDAAQAPVSAPAAELTAQLNVRIPGSLSDRLDKAAITLSSRRGVRTPKVSVVEEALNAFFDANGL